MRTADPRILVITLRRLGDVLLATSLVHTLRAAWPSAPIDMLVFRGSEGILAGNPEIADVLTIPVRPSLGDMIGMARRLWRQYDISISTQSGDRPTFFAWVAGRKRVGMVGEDGIGNAVKRLMLHESVPNNPRIHRVEELLLIADRLGIARAGELVCPQGPIPPGLLPNGRYAVLHANPKFSYRRWPAAAWHELAAALKARGLTVVVTGAPDAAERAYLDALWQPASTPVIRLDGKLDWPQLAALLHGATVFVGPDTSMTHLAAGSGCPTVALYGPASPTIIGPWPTGGLAEPWAPAGRIQHRANVWLVQNPLPCLPCEKLGCENRLDSYSQCLDELSAAQVLSAVDAALGRRAVAQMAQ